MTTSNVVEIPSSQPLLHQRGLEVQGFGTLRQLPIAVRNAITRTAANRDDGTNDLLMGDMLRCHELQVWLLAEHLVDIRAV